MKYVLPVIAFLFCTPLIAQETSHEAPTLQVGLGGLNFQKGTLDKELILAIIAEKQQEIKAELIKNMLLGKLGLGGGAFYTYVDNVITILLSKKDVEITNRALLESTINIVFNYSLVDYYIRTASDAEKEEIYKLAMGFGFVLPGDRKTIQPVQNLADFSHPRFTHYSSENAAKNNNLSHSNQNEALTQVVGVLMDIGAEIIRNNDFLRQRGLLQAPYHSGARSLNTYLSMPYCDTPPAAFTTLRNYATYQNEVTSLSQQTDLSFSDFDTRLGELRKQHQISQFAAGTKCFADSIYNSMKARMDTILQYVGLMYYLRNLSDMSTEKLGKLTSDEIKQVLFNTVSSQKKDQLIQHAMVKLKAVIAEKHGDQAQKILADALQLLSRLRRSDITKPALNNNSQLLFYLKSYVLPTLSELIYKSPSSVDLAEVMEDLGALMASELFDQMGNSHTLLTQNQKTAFLNLLSRLYEFDKPETISAYMNILPEIGGIFPNSNVQQSINMVSSYIKQYTTFGSDEENQEYLNIDVEGLLGQLKEIKLNRFRPLEFHFTVGSSTLFFDKKQTFESGKTTNSLSIVGEKIGLKFKLIDWEYLRTFNKGETFKYYGRYYTRTAPPAKPVVSNLHILAYGSGLVYNLANSTTETDFNAPFFGLNLGLTFFNNLDFSIGRGFPLFADQSFKTNIKNGAWTFGFDIQFGEYLARLNEKRLEQKRSRKIEKYVAEKKTKNE